MNLRRLIAATSLTRMYWMAGATIATMVTARCLGPDGRGVIAATTSWLFMLFTFGHLSLAHVVMYVAGGSARSQLPAVVGVLLAVTAAIAAIAWFVVLALYVLAHQLLFEHIPLSALLVVLAALPCLIWMEYANSLLIVAGDVHRLNVAQITGTTTTIVVVVVGVAVLKGGVVVALFANLAGYLVTIAVGMPVILAAAGTIRVARPVAVRLLREGARLHVGAVGTFFLTYASVILLNHWRPLPEVGWYQLALQLTIALQVVPMAMTTVAYSLVSRDGPDQAWAAHRRLVGQTMAYAVVAALGVLIGAPLAVRLVGGPGFEPAVAIARILGLSVFGAAFSAVMTPQWVVRGYFGAASALSLLAVAVGLIGNWTLIPRFGPTGAAWTMVASYMIHFVGNGAFAWRIERRLGRGLLLQRV